MQFNLLSSRSLTCDANCDFKLLANLGRLHTLIAKVTVLSAPYRRTQSSVVTRLFQSTRSVCGTRSRKAFCQMSVADFEYTVSMFLFALCVEQSEIVARPHFFRVSARGMVLTGANPLHHTSPCLHSSMCRQVRVLACSRNPVQNSCACRLAQDCIHA